MPFHVKDFPNYFSTEKSGGSLVINYDLSDETHAGTINYKRAIWPINQYYNTLTADSLFTYLVCGFDSLIDPTNTYSFSYHSLSTFQIDSVWIGLGHENNSGLNDTLVVQVITLNPAGYPSSQIVWADTMFFSSGQSPSNQWTVPYIFRLAPALNWTSSLKPAIKLQYKAPLQDTLGIIAGYRFSGTCGIGDAAQWSAFYPNSYAYWTGFNALIPTSAGGDIYYDCNANLQFDSLIDGRNYIQNWHIGIQITAPEIGVEPLNLFYTPEVYPNPAVDRFYIQYPQPILLVEIYNAQGVLVQLQNHCHCSDGVSLQQLHNGMYFIHIKTATHTYVKKLLVHNTLH